MTIEVVDTRPKDAGADSLERRFPVGSFVYLRDRRFRVTVVGHDAGNLVMLHNGTKLIEPPTENFVLIAQSAEHYVERVTSTVDRIAQEHGVRSTSYRDQMKRLTTDVPNENPPLRVVVTHVAHFVLYPAQRDITAEQLTDELQRAYVPRSAAGEFSSRFVTHHDTEDGTQYQHSITIEIVDEFPSS